jgi:hypothetical protein
VLREQFGPDVRLQLVPTERNTWRRRIGLAASGGQALNLVDGVIAAIEERLLWSRFGL